MKKNKKVLLSLSCCLVLGYSNSIASDIELDKAELSNDMEVVLNKSNINVNKNTQDSQDIIISNINVSGLNAFSIDYILDVLDIPYNQEISPILVRQKIESLMKTKRFEYINISYKGDTLLLNFKEYDKISKVRYNLESSIDVEIPSEDKELLEKFSKLEPGMVFIPKYKENYISQITKFFIQKGYSNPQFELIEKHIDNGTVILDININKLSKLVINKVNFNGHNEEVFSNDELEELTKNEAKESFSWFWGRSDGSFNRYAAENEDPRTLADALASKGYLDVQVSIPEIEQEKDTISLNYTIVEGPKYILENYTIKGLPEDNEELIEDINDQDILIKNQDFINNNVKDYIKHIDRVLRTYGYAFPKITPKFNKIDNKASIEFIVEPGNIYTINDIFIQGNTKTQDNVIRRSLYILPGDTFSLVDFEDSINFLNRQGYFENAQIQLNKVSDTQLDLIVKVKETKTGNISIGGGYGSYEGFVFDSSFSERNFLGTGYNLHSNISRSDKDLNYNIGVTNPGIFDSHISGTFNAQNSDSEAIYDNYIINKNKMGFSVGAGYKWNRYLDLGVTFTHLENEDEYTLNDGSKSLEKYLTQSVTPSFTFNTTDDFYVPRKGWHITGAVEFAGFGGESQYAKTQTKVKYYRDLTRLLGYDVIFRNKTVLKTLHDLGNISASESLSLGGPHSVRGYQTYAFSNDNLNDPILNMYATNSTELSVNISNSMKIRGFGFFDVGALGHNTFDKYQKMGTGLGVEWISPIGPIQLIYAQPINANDTDKTSNFEIAIGTTF